MDWFLFLLHVKTFRYVMAVKCYTLVLNSYACSQSTSKICNIITFITRICSAFVLHFKVPLEMMWVGSMILALFAGIFNTFVYNSDMALQSLFGCCYIIILCTNGGGFRRELYLCGFLEWVCPLLRNRTDHKNTLYLRGHFACEF